MRRSALLAILMAFSTLAFSYPIAPRPLRLLVDETDIIITGKVIRIDEVRDTDNTYGGSHVAVILVDEVLKGNRLPDTVYINYEPGMICPAPPEFIEGSTALIFLDRYKGKYMVHALSYGVKTLDQQGLAVYKERINEMLDILQMQDGKEKTAETIEWLVKCAESPYTRWEGSYELHPGGDFMSFYSDGRSKDLSYYLDEEQMERIKMAVTTAAEFQYALLPLVDIVYRHNEKELDITLERFLSDLPETELWAAGEIMKRLQHKVDADNYKKLTEELDNALYTRGSLPDVKKTIDKFMLLCRQ